MRMDKKINAAQDNNDLCTQNVKGGGTLCSLQNGLTNSTNQCLSLAGLPEIC